MVSQLKEALRRQMLKKRDSLSKEEAAIMSDGIAEALLKTPRFIEAKRIAFYITKGSEADTRMMIFRAMQAGKEVLIPATDHKITFYKFSSFSDLKPGKYGILEPQTRDAPEAEPDAIIVPGVCFGLCMHRLGYGKGYYDKYLANSPAYRIGICYDFQVVERLPTHENDERMDEIVTDKRVISL
ncbi:5-formyltetrahydrofolate cyclo-ligase [Candidatus Micrarchaeota archaeon]|nr:5-formyltetrahydrofolate cyclo-ligase [Candidatus Micrarchaeota archaeon]